MTLFQFDSSDANTEDAATNQQLPSCPCWISLAFTPSSMSFGLSHIS